MERSVNCLYFGLTSLHRFLGATYGERNVHRAPIVRFREACPGTVWLSCMALAVDRVCLKRINVT